MTPKLTLELNHDSVRLLRRQRDGETEVGAVPLDQPDLKARLAAMREQVGDGAIAAVIVVPSSLVLFLEAGDMDDVEIAARIAEKTPCPIAELAIARSGSLAAAVERATLEEARAFATDHGFLPASYAARRQEGGEEVSFHLEPVASPAFRNKRLAAVEEAAPPPTTTPGPAPTPAPQAAPLQAATEPRRRPAGRNTAVEGRVPASATRPVPSPRSEKEAFTIFGARDRAPRSRGPKPLHWVAAVLGVAVLFAAYALVDDRQGSVDLVGLDRVEATLDPILEGEAVALDAAAATETRAGSAPEAAPKQPTPRIRGETVVPDAPPSGAPPVPALPRETARTEATEMATLAQPPEPDVGLPAAFTRPPPPGTVFDMDERGLVRPSEDGAPTPHGVLVYSGPPAVVPPDGEADEAAAEPRPQVAAVEPDASQSPQEAVPAADPDIARTRPQERPGTETSGIVVVAEAAGGDTPRPLDRPAAVEQMTVASTGPEDDPDALLRQAQPETAGATAALAGTRAVEPPPQAPAEQTQAAVQPTLPTRASVADRATLDSAIRLDRVNLIGVYGSPSDRRALIRLPTGRYVKVKVGDHVDGGRIAAIQASSLEYVKGGQRFALTMPNG